ncbi:MAG: DegV family protein, partial [Oscillospiraceae bacterium]
MQQWRLVADSSCDLAELGGTDDHIGFATVPLTIRVGETDYVDVPSTDSQTMLAHMKEHKGPSSSCCPAPTAFAEEFRRAANTFAVTITSGLSGTYNCAMQAMHMVMEEHPDRHIHVIDSRATAGCMVLILRHLRELIEQGLCFDEIVNRIERYRNESRIIFSLASFDNLVKNGRMSRTSGLLASALNIRAVSINSEAGQIQVLEKPR